MKNFNKCNIALFAKLETGCPVLKLKDIKSNIVENNFYTFVGVYNKNRTKIKNVITNEIYNVNFNKETLNELVTINNNLYEEVTLNALTDYTELKNNIHYTYKIMPHICSNKNVLKNLVMYEHGKCATKNDIGGKFKNCLKMCTQENLTLDEIRDLTAELNNAVSDKYETRLLLINKLTKSKSTEQERDF